MRFSISEYLNYSQCAPDIEKYKQVELNNEHEHSYVFIPEQFALTGSYIQIRKDANSPWSDTYRIGHTSIRINEIHLERNEYAYIKDENIKFIKKQICRSNSKGIIECHPK